MTDAGRAGEPEGTVMVVDDDAGMCETVVEILSAQGITAEGAGSAEQAVQLAAAVKPAVAVVDHRLPDASGVQLAARLKAEDPDIQVLLLTGYATLETAIAAVGQLDDFLTKPVPPDQLIRAVRSALDRGRLRRENAQLVFRLRQANSRLQESVAERTRDLAGIMSLADSLSRAIAVDEVVLAATTAMVEATGAEAGAVYLFDESSASLELRGAVGAEAFPEHLPSRQAGDRGRPGHLDLSIRAELTVAGQPVGVIVLSRPQQANPQLVATLSTLAALAVQNSQRYARERQTVERLSQLDRMKDTLLASVSHELRTPLAAIVGFAEVLERHGDGMDPVQRAEILRRMVSQGARLSRLIENILSSTIIEGDLMRVVGGPVPVSGVIDRVVTSVPEGIPVKVEVAEPLPAVMADTGRLEQVLGNLVDNAVKYGGGEEIVLTARAWEPGVVELRVTDRGPGIDAEFVEEVFQPFTQSPSTPRVQGGGVGLGLYIARRLMEAMGGSIGVETRPGEGATFWLRLQAAQTGAPRQSEP